VPQYPIAGYANGQGYGYYNYVMVRVRSGQLFAMVTFRAGVQGRCPGGNVLHYTAVVTFGLDVA